jgi:hypothetical protein
MFSLFEKKEKKTSFVQTCIAEAVLVVEDFGFLRAILHYGQGL